MSFETAYAWTGGILLGVASAWLFYRKLERAHWNVHEAWNDLWSSMRLR
jgi:hypothetical protein